MKREEDEIEKREENMIEKMIEMRRRIIWDIMDFLVELIL